jgi:transmembrane sensor
MNSDKIYNIPWELISSSFSGGLSEEEALVLQDWIASNPSHKEKYQKLQEIWNNGIEDYKIYLMANETKAWNALKYKLNSNNNAEIKKFKPHNKYRIIYRVSVAAVLLILAGLGYWYTVSISKKIVYLTASYEQKNIQLTDGSNIALKPATQIELSKGFGKENRTLFMSSGEATFDVKHNSNLSFIVNIGNVNVKDIGTVFNIKKEYEQIKVTVIEGMVVFNKPSTKETKNLSAGMSLTYYLKNDSIGNIQTNNSETASNYAVLNFKNTPLKDVIELIQIKYNKNIQLENSIADKKFTANLEGIPYNTALEVICKSLNLDYKMQDSIYILQGNVSH